MTVRRPDTIAACVALAATALLFAFDPATTWWFPSCPFHALTGWLCPLCGTLRAVHALLDGAPGAALALNPMAVTALLSGVVALAHDALWPARHRQFPRLTSLLFSARGVVLVVAFALLRNLPPPVDWIIR